MSKYLLNKSHPRYKSLYYRDLLAKGVEMGITSLQGLTAHGRGEAFDYLLNEKTHNFAVKSIDAAAVLFLTAKHTVISVNGNVAILIPKELIKLSDILDAPIEINLFHTSEIREKNIAKYLQKLGAKKILFPQNVSIPGISSNRKWINTYGQKGADVIFVPLEDGDRTEALIALGKKVVTIDLNPLSRTARTASITIVDNITRTMPKLISAVSKFRNISVSQRNKILSAYNNNQTLKYAISSINKRLQKLYTDKNDKI